jgi:hypothetical protein
VFGADGSYVGSISESRLNDPHNIKIDGNMLYVVDRLAGLFAFELPDTHASGH